MAPDEQRRLDLQRSQNIALLSLLTKNPASIGVNTCPVHIQNHLSERRLLSFSRESHLSEALAFITGISDSSDHITAVSLEELPKGAKLRVLVAVNRSTHNNPTDERILGRIKSGLEVVFRLLTRASTGIRDNSIALEEQVTDAIIDLCRDRILARMRSQRNDASISKSKGRPFAGSNLETILSAVRNHSFRKRIASQSAVQLLIRQIERLIEVLNKVESCKAKRVNVTLKELIVTACSLHRGRRAVNIAGILGDLSTTELNPTDGLWFRTWIRKLSRYRECAGYLFRTARKSSLFTNVTVTPVSLGQEYFARQGDNPKETCLASCITRCRQEDPQCGKAQANAGIAALTQLGGSEFLPALRKIVKDARIHAEVQIVAYYELHPAAIPPRIIKSSKDACYLCHMFIKEHGKFFTPRTHGRLYNGWRIPNVASLNSAQVKLNRDLQARIWEGALDYVQTRRVQGLISVNESDVGSLSSMSSLGSFGLLTEKVVVNKLGPTEGLPGIEEVPSSKKATVPETRVPVKSSKGKEKEVIGYGEITAQILEPIKEEPAVIAAQQSEAGSPSDWNPVRLPLVEPVQIPDDRLPGEQALRQEHEQLPVAEEIRAAHEAITADQDVQLSGSQSSFEYQGQSQDTLSSKEARDGQTTTAQTSPDPEQELELETDAGLETRFESKEFQSGPESQPEPQPEVPTEEEGDPELGQSLPNESSLEDTSSHGDLNHDLEPPSADSQSKSLPQTSQIRAPSPGFTGSKPGSDHDSAEDTISESKQVQEDITDDDQYAEIILTQGQPSICILTGPKNNMQRIPCYRNGKNGKLVVHPEYIITKPPSSSEDSRETVEMRITWLSESTSRSPDVVAKIEIEAEAEAAAEATASTTRT
ncbi:hypothetical protein V8F20_001646 [Naviculisporaceae sp. PSN 640]